MYFYRRLGKSTNWLNLKIFTNCKHGSKHFLSRVPTWLQAWKQQLPNKEQTELSPSGAITTNLINFDYRAARIGRSSASLSNSILNEVPCTNTKTGSIGPTLTRPIESYYRTTTSYRSRAALTCAISNTTATFPLIQKCMHQQLELGKHLNTSSLPLARRSCFHCCKNERNWNVKSINWWIMFSSMYILLTRQSQGPTSS